MLYIDIKYALDKPYYVIMTTRANKFLNIFVMRKHLWSQVQ